MTGAAAVVVAFSLFGLGGGKAAPGGECVEAMRRALDGGKAEWTMERRIGKGGRVLKTSGTVECEAGKGIKWRVKEPFETTVEMTADAMVFTDEEGTRRKPLSELPHYAELRERTDAFAAGDAKAFDGLFEVEQEDAGGGGWKLTMEPEVGAMKRLFTRVELTGGALPTNAVMRTGDGGECRIRFRSSQQPTASSQQPASGSQQSAASSQQPTSGSQQSAAGSQQSAASSQQPTASSQHGGGER